MKIHYEMDLDIEDWAELELSKLEKHVDWLFDPRNWPEIRRIYNVRAKLNNERETTESSMDPRFCRNVNSHGGSDSGVSIFDTGFSPWGDQVE